MSIDPGRTIAAVLGAADFPSYPSFQGSGGPAFAASARAFTEFLEAHYGAEWRKDRLLDLFDDDGGQDDQVTALSDFLTEHKDGASRLIFYYVGHGGLFGQDEYFLAIKKTREKFERTSGLGIKALADVVYTCFPGREVFLILDCCFAGKAVDAMMSGDVNQRVIDDTDRAFTAGTALLCASSKRDVALSTGVGACTQFTESLIEVLRDGIPGAGELLTLRDMGDAVRDLVRGRFGLEAVDPEVHSPRQQGIDVANQPLFLNPAYVPPNLAALRPDLAEDLCNEEKHLLREGAARELGRLIRGDDPVLAKVAEQALRERLESGDERDRYVYETIQSVLAPLTPTPDDAAAENDVTSKEAIARGVADEPKTSPKPGPSALRLSMPNLRIPLKPPAVPQILEKLKVDAVLPKAPVQGTAAHKRMLVRLIYVQMGLTWVCAFTFLALGST